VQLRHHADEPGLRPCGRRRQRHHDSCRSRTTGC
jgi:hypothetical protein